MKLFGQKEIKLKNTVVDWERVFRAKQNNLIGLDIGSSAVKAVQLAKNDDKYKVIAAGMAEYEGDKAKTIRQCLQSAGIESKLAVCGVCGSETAIRPFKFPLLASDEIEGAVRLEAKQVCPFNADEAVIDYQLTGEEKNQTSGILVVATDKSLKEKAKIVKDASLVNVLMDIDGLALLNCLQYCQGDEEQTKAVLNVGSACATLAIISSDGIPFVRDVNINLSGGCDKLISDVTETLCYDADRRKSEIVNKIYLCGRYSLTDGFADMLNKKLAVPIILWNPFDKIYCDPDLPCAAILCEKGPAFAVAAGLAMREIPII